MDYKAVGKRIREKRLNYKLTQEKLSELVDVCPSYIGEIERGNSIPSIATVVNIAKELDLNLDFLLLGITSKNSNSYFNDLLESIPDNKKDLFIKLCENIAKTLKDDD